MATLDKVFKDASVKKLFKDLLILAQYVGRRQGNEAALKEEVRQAFRANMHEVDDDKILAHKEAAMRALGNFYFQEAERLARGKGGGGGGKGGKGGSSSSIGGGGLFQPRR